MSTNIDEGGSAARLAHTEAHRRSTDNGRISLADIPASEKVGRLRATGYALPQIDFDAGVVTAALASEPYRTMRAATGKIGHIDAPSEDTARPSPLIPAPDGRLVVPLDVVLQLGDGDVARGTRMLDQLTWRIRLRQRRSTPPVQAPDERGVDEAGRPPLRRTVGTATPGVKLMQDPSDSMQSDGGTGQVVTIAPTVCDWCTHPFRPRVTGGRAQRFCKPRCRLDFHSAARTWALEAVIAGSLTVAALKTGFAATCTFAGGRFDAAPVFGDHSECKLHSEPACAEAAEHV